MRRVLIAIVGAGLQGALLTQAPDPAPLLAAARVALGGEQKLSAVTSFTAHGRTRRVRGKNLVPIEFEISCALPDKYVKQDEIPAEETGLMKAGFNGEVFLQAPPPDADEKGTATTARLTAAKQDFARLTLALFAASFRAYPLTFAYAGRAEAPEGAAEALDAKSTDGFATRLFLDRATHLPVMLSWRVSTRSGAVEHRQYLSDYREVDGLRWPFTVRHAVAGETIEETVFDRFRLNPKIDPRKFEVSR